MNSRRNKTILIVDNDPAVVAALTARLGGIGYDCTAAGCGAQALTRFHETPPDLVISDLKMPQGDGIALAESIRRISRVPIILMSGFKIEYRKSLRHIPDVLFLHKPFDSALLIELVEGALVEAQTRAMHASRAA